eukprot:EG_transcript_15813
MKSLTAGSSLPKKSEEVTAMCWTEATGESFNVRAVGYKTKNLKQPSGPSLYDTVAVDAYSSPKKVPHFAQYVDIPEPEDGHGVPYNLVVNLMIPRYAPNLVWAAAGDGESWCVVLYCRLSEAAREMLRTNQPSPALKLWKRFVEADRNDPMKQRLKCIVRALNPTEVGFSTATRSLINKYNAKPFMIRTTSSFYTGDNYYEIDIDIHNFGKTARIGLYGCSEVATQADFDLSATIQGETDDELPEQILFGVRLDKLNPAVVNVVPFDIASPGNRTPPRQASPRPAEAVPDTEALPDTEAEDDTVHPDEE